MEEGNGSPPSRPQPCPFSHNDFSTHDTEGLPSINQSNEQHPNEGDIALARMVCYEGVAPRSVCGEHGAFRQFIQTVNPNHTLRLDKDFLQRNCLKIYDEERRKVKEIFSELEGRISLSFDVPMYLYCPDGILQYMCLAAHFIDNDWKLQRWVIKYCRWALNPTVHTFKSLKEWGILDKVFALTVGGTNGTADLLKEGVQKRWGAQMNDHMFHWQVSCCDIISDTVQEAFGEISDIISKVELLAWSKSLPLWYLTSTKLRNALELEAMGEFSSEGVGQDYEVPSEEEWAKVKSICRIADQIYEIVKGLFEVKRPTANLFLPYLQEIRAYLIKELANPNEFVKALAEKMFKTFDEYWQNTYVVLAIAAFMDPRYKMKFIEFSFSKSEGGDGDSKASYVLGIIRKLYNGYLVQIKQKVYSLVDSSSENEDEEDEEEGSQSHKHAKKECRNLAETLSVLSMYCQAVQSTNEDEDLSYKSDLDLYLEEPILPWTEDFSVLLWWKDSCSKYPYLSKMAHDFLAIPFSVASSCEAYYTEPREADKTVFELKSEFMNALMCTRGWKLNYKKKLKR